jgi:4-aminobutyrate aminotransferase-like enzyme
MNAATHEIAAVGAHLNEVYPMLPFTPVRGTGVYLENAAGRRILDLYGGHAVAALGYGHPDLSEALARQSRELVFQTNALPLKIRDEAAEKLAAFGPPGLGRVFFVNSGAEANENALRLAFKVTGRSKVVAMEHSFHGRTAAAAAVTYGAAMVPVESRAIGTPTTNPTTVCPTAPRTTSRMTRPRLAPSAIRMPISRVCRETEYAVTA